MNRNLTRILPVTALLLAACGGEPAPDTTAEVAAAEVAAAEVAAAEVAATEAVMAASGRSANRSMAAAYVVHGINGKDLGLPEALPVDVQVGDACALTGFQFRSIAGPLSLPPGTYDVKVRLAATPACSGAVAISAPGLVLDAGANVSIVAHLDDAAPSAPTASVFANDVTIAFGRSRAIARHAAAFGGVDVLVDGKVAFANLTNGEQGTATLRPGHHTLAIAPAGTTGAVFEKDLVLRPFMVYAAYAVGTPSKGTFEVLLQTLPMSRWPEWVKPATAYLVHGINGKDLGAAEALPVDVEVGGKCALIGFEFRDVAGPLKLAPGTYDVNVRLAATPACSGAVAIAAPGLKLAPGANVTIVAHLADAATATPTASVFSNDTSKTRGKARVVARHGANFGPVDVLVNGAVAFPDLANGKQAMADLKNGTYQIAIAPAGTTTEVYANTLKLKPGRAYNAYAVGTPSGGTFEVLLQETRLGRHCDLSRGEGHD